MFTDINLLMIEKNSLECSISRHMLKRLSQKNTYDLGYNNVALD